MTDNEQNIIEALRRTRFRAASERDAQIRAAMSRELPGGRDRSQIPSRWRMLIRRAAVVLLPLGVVAAMVFYLQRSTLSLAQLNEAYAKQKWVHIKYDNGQEQWTDLENDRYFFRAYDGRTVYVEPQGLRLIWWPKFSPSYIDKDQWYVGDKPPPRARNQTPWEALVARSLQFATTQATTRPAARCKYAGC